MLFVIRDATIIHTTSDMAEAIANRDAAVAHLCTTIRSKGREVRTDERDGVITISSRSLGYLYNGQVKLTHVVGIAEWTPPAPVVPEMVDRAISPIHTATAETGTRSVAPPRTRAAHSINRSTITGRPKTTTVAGISVPSQAPAFGGVQGMGIWDDLGTLLGLGREE